MNTEKRSKSEWIKVVPGVVVSLIAIGLIAVFIDLDSLLRAIQKANPLPPFPEELDEDFLEIGIRFHPE